MKTGYVIEYSCKKGFFEELGNLLYDIWSQKM